MKRLWKIWEMRYREHVLMIVGMLICAALAGNVLNAVIVVLGAERYAILGSFLALVLWAAYTFFAEAFSLEKQFGMAVAMGRTRREFLLSHWIMLILNTAIELLVIFCLNIVEKAAAGVFYRGLPCGFDLVSQFCDYRIILAALLLAPATGLFLGMLLTKFQIKAFWGIWLVWMAGSIFLPKLAHGITENPDSIPARIVMTVLEGIAGLGAYGQLAAAAVVSLIFLLVSVTVLEKQAVTQV